MPTLFAIAAEPRCSGRAAYHGRVTVHHQHARGPSTHLAGCLGFWLWALAGAGMVFGMISFIVFFLIPPAVLVVWLMRRSRWTDGPALTGILAGAGVPLLVVAGLQWNAWHDRVVGDNTPNPYYWGGVGLFLLMAGVAAFEFARRRSG
jgi:hypothetical protein